MRGYPTHYPQKQVAKEINLKELYQIIKRRLWIVIAITVIFTGVGAVYSTYFTTPLYQSSARIIIKADAEYQKTLQVIMKDTIMLEKVVQKLNLTTTPESLAGQINVASVEGTQVVSISVVDTEPKRAADIANTTAEIFKAEIPKIEDFKDVKYLSKAKVNPYPINENQNRTVILAFVFGLAIGIGLVLLLDSLDDSIKSEHDIENLLDLPVIGTVSKMNQKNIKKKYHRQSGILVRGETIGFK